MFADDTMLFCEVNINGFQNMKNILVVYEVMSCQEVNFSKSCFLISPTVDGNKKKNIKNLMNMHLMPEGMKYLGMPLFWG